MAKAGQLFGIVEDHLEKYQPLESFLINNRASSFFFKAQGQAMAPLIQEGDILVVDRSIPLYHQAIVLVACGQEYLCRRFQQFENKKVFSCENRNFAPLVISHERSDWEAEIMVFGVVVGLGRSLMNHENKRLHG